MKIFPLKRPEKKLISILEKIKEYLLVSDDSDWSSKTPNEIIIELDESIQNLRVRILIIMDSDSDFYWTLSGAERSPEKLFLKVSI